MKSSKCNKTSLHILLCFFLQRFCGHAFPVQIKEDSLHIKRVIVKCAFAVTLLALVKTAASMKPNCEVARLAGRWASTALTHKTVVAPSVLMLQVFALGFEGYCGAFA